MSIDKDSSLKSESSAIGRPPAVRESLWAMIPDGMRRSYVEHAALCLRRGVHPEDAISTLLVADGHSRSAVEKAMREIPAAAVVVEDSRDEAGHAEPRVLLWPYGTGGYDLGKEPAGPIGERLQSVGGLTAEGAAAVEWRILRAIARDPSFVMDDPANLRFLGCDIGPAHLAAVYELVDAESRSVEADVRARQASGDTAALDWIDPRDSIFNAFES